MDMPNQIVKAKGVIKEEPNETLSSPEVTVAIHASPGGGPVLAVKPEPSTTGKRKRGRPRKSISGKSNSEETMMGPPPTPAPPPSNGSPPPLALPVPPPPAESSSTAGRRRGRPKNADKIKLLRIPPTGLVHSVRTNFMPIVVTVPARRDIIQELSAYVQEENVTLVPLSATGVVSSVTFYSSNPGGEKTTYEGRHVINVLQGSLNRKYGLLSLWMTDTEGNQIGGCVGGPLIAGNQVQIIFGTFEDVVDRKYKRKQRMADASAAADAQTENGVDDGELIDVPVQTGETVESNATPGPEGSPEGDPIMASPITIVPPASSLPEGSDEEEPIKASPITVVPLALSLPEGSDEEEPVKAGAITTMPPASSLPEGSEEEEPIKASPTTIVPPASSLREGSDEEEPIPASAITIVPPASSVPETPDDQNESGDICGSDPEK